MLPVLFSLGPINFYTLAFLLAIGFFLASFIIWRRLRELGLTEERVIDFILGMAFLGLLFSRLFFIIANFERFRFFLDRWILFYRYPGFSFGGGLLGIFLTWWWFVKKEKWDFWQIGDEITFGFLPFLILAQLGAFFDGSSLGKSTSMPWGVYFPGSLLRRQPVSLFMAILLLLIWFFLLRIERQWRFWDWYKSKASGFICLMGFGLIFLANFLLAFWRDTKVYFYWLEIGLSFLGVVIVSILFYGKARR